MIEEVKISDTAQDTWMKASKLTGEMLPFLTPYSTGNSKGVENVGKDECYTDEYVSLQDTMRKYLRDGYRDLSDEFALDDAGDFDDRPSDIFDEDDPIERQIALEEWQDRHPAETQESVSADVGTASDGANDKRETQGTNAESASSENGDVEA